MNNNEITSSPKVTNDNQNAFITLTQSLAEQTGIDFESATKVMNWLKNEGVIDFPVVTETYAEVN